MATKAKVSTEEWIEELKGISVLELSERVKALEEEFGVSATAVAAAAPAAAGAGGGGAGGGGELTVGGRVPRPRGKQIPGIKGRRAPPGPRGKEAQAPAGGP